MAIDIQRFIRTSSVFVGNQGAPTPPAVTPPTPPDPPASDIEFNENNVVGPPSGTTNNGVYSVTSNNITVTTAPSSAEDGIFWWYTENPSSSTDDVISFSATYTGAGNTGISIGLLKPATGQSIQDAAQAFLDSGGNGAPGIEGVGGVSAIGFSVAAQLSPSTIFGNISSLSLSSGDVVVLRLIKSTNTVELEMNGTVVSTAVATALTSSQNYHAAFNFPQDIPLNSGDSIQFDFSGL